MAKKAVKKVAKVVEIDKNASPKDTKNKLIELALKEIKTKFGDEAIMTYGSSKVAQVESIPSGSIGLDAALGIGGYPRGRIIEVFGPESSGKTTLTLHAIAEAQKKGGVCAFVDAEHALDPEYAKRIGVKLSELLISQPDTGEQALEIVESLVRSNSVDIIVVDSVAALTPKDEMRVIWVKHKWENKRALCRKRFENSLHYRSKQYDYYFHQSNSYATWCDVW
jgi:protein RecA